MIYRILLSFILIFLISEKVLSQVHSSIVLKGIPKSSLNKVLQKQPKLLQNKLTQAKIENVLSAFYATEDFENIIVSSHGENIIIEGIPLKTITSISIKGVQKLTEKSVIGALSLNTGDKFRYQSIITGAENIKELYNDSGFLNAEVEVLPIYSSNKVALQVQVQENQQCEISDINFSTSFEDLSQQLKNKTLKLVNKPLSDKSLDDIDMVVKEYLKTNRIINASIQGPTYSFNKERTKVKLLYIIENAQKFTVSFEGNKFLSKTELLDKLEIGERTQASSNPTAELAAKIEQVYHSYGFANVQVKYNEVQRGQTTSRRVYFTIIEGERIYLKNIYFHGNLSQNQKFYKNLFYETYNTSYFKQELAKEALENLLISLQNIGYLKSKYLSQQINFSEDKRRAEIQVYLDEGVKTIVKSIRFKGIQAVSASQLENELQIKPNSPLNLSKLENSIEVIENFYRSQGYLDVDVKTRLEDIIKYSKDDTQADLQFEIHEGPQVKVNKIIIEGNSLTKNYIILNELEFNEGDILTPQNISDSEYHLQKTQLFSSIEIIHLEKGTNVSNRTVVIKVQERDPGQVTFGIGVTTEFDFTLRGYASVGYRNMAGTARAITLAGEVKQVSDINFIDHSVVLSYLEPTLWTKRMRGRIALIRAREIFTRTPETKVIETNTANFFIEKDFSRYLKLTWNLWSLSTNKIFTFPSKLVEEDVDIASIGPTLEWDKRNDPFITRKGYFAKISAEYAHDVLGSSDTVHYTRYDSRFNVYKPIKFLNTTWALSLRGGYMLNMEDQKNSHIPEIKQFRLGGRDTIRGFEPNEIPREFDKYGRKVQINKDSHYYLVNSEFRIPLYGDIETVLFYDGGSVLVRGFTFEDNYRDSVGIGLRYITPVGPLSVEYGYKLDKNRDLDESPYRIHLSFGTF